MTGSNDMPEIDGPFPFRTRKYDAVEVIKNLLNDYIELRDASVNINCPPDIVDRTVEPGRSPIPNGCIYLDRPSEGELQLDIYKHDEDGQWGLFAVFFYSKDHGGWYYIDFVEDDAKPADKTPQNENTYATQAEPRRHENAYEPMHTQQVTSWMPSPILLGDQFWKYTFLEGTILAVDEGSNFTEVHFKRTEGGPPQGEWMRLWRAGTLFRQGMGCIITHMSLTSSQTGYFVVIDSYDNHDSMFFHLEMIESYIGPNANKLWGGKDKNAERFYYRYFLNTYYAHFHYWSPHDSIGQKKQTANRLATEWVQHILKKRRSWKPPHSWTQIEVDNN